MYFTFNILSRTAKAEFFLFCFNLHLIYSVTLSSTFFLFMFHFLARLYYYYQITCLILLSFCSTFIFNCVTQVLDFIFWDTEFCLGLVFPLPQSIDDSLKFIDFFNCINSIFCLVVSANCKYQQNLALTVEMYAFF